MDQSKWDKINAILDEALDSKNPKKQERVICEACNNDEQLYNQVFSLLRSIKRARKFNFLELE